MVGRSSFCSDWLPVEVWGAWDKWEGEERDFSHAHSSLMYDV